MSAQPRYPLKLYWKRSHLSLSLLYDAQLSSHLGGHALRLVHHHLAHDAAILKYLLILFDSFDRAGMGSVN